MMKLIKHIECSEGERRGAEEGERKTWKNIPPHFAAPDLYVVPPPPVNSRRPRQSESRSPFPFRRHKLFWVPHR